MYEQIPEIPKKLQYIDRNKTANFGVWQISGSEREWYYFGKTAFKDG